MNLKGVIVPLLTPLNADESLDEAGLARHIEHVLAGGVNGIFLLGSTGEFAALSPETKQLLLDRAIQHIARRVPVLVGVNECGTRESARFAERAARAGADVLVASAPFYYMHSQTELLAHLRAIIESAGLPVALYNIPQRVKLALNFETVQELAAHSRVIGLKDSAGDMAGFQKFLELRRDHPPFQIWQGSDPVAALSLVRGADGIVLGQSNIAPRLCRHIYDAVQSGRLADAWALQEKLTALFSIVLHKSGPAGMKTALHILGICEPHVTAPFEQLTREQTEKVRRTLEETGVLEGAVAR